MGVGLMRSQDGWRGMPHRGGDLFREPPSHEDLDISRQTLADFDERLLRANQQIFQFCARPKTTLTVKV